MRNQLGLTIFEILIGITITAVAGFLITGLLTSSGEVFLSQTEQVNQGLSSSQARQEIEDLIKSSAGVVGQYPPTGTAQFTTGSQVLVLKIPTVGVNGKVIDSVFDYAVVTKYPVNSKILKKMVFPDAQSNRSSENKVISSSLKSLGLVYLDKNNNQVPPTQSARITYTINLSSDEGLTENSSSSSGTVNLKNL